MASSTTAFSVGGDGFEAVVTGNLKNMGTAMLDHTILQSLIFNFEALS